MYSPVPIVIAFLGYLPVMRLIVLMLRRKDTKNKIKLDNYFNINFKGFVFLKYRKKFRLCFLSSKMEDDVVL